MGLIFLIPCKTVREKDVQQVPSPGPCCIFPGIIGEQDGPSSHQGNFTAVLTATVLNADGHFIWGVHTQLSTLSKTELLQTEYKEKSYS